MKQISRLLLLCIVCTALQCVNEQTPSAYPVVSPDGNIVLTFTNFDAGIFYSVKAFGEELLSPSRLGYILKDLLPLSTGFRISRTETDSHDETWEQPWGEQRLIREQYNALSIYLEETQDPSRKLEIQFRVFNDGIGFRYVIPEQTTLENFEITDELTEFNFTSNPQAWWIKAYQPERYEYLFQNTPMNAIDSIAHTPLTMQVSDSMYVSIHEADLTNYPAMSLAVNGNNGLKCDLAPWSDGARVKANAPMQSPWRTIMIVRSAADLITSRLTLNLNPPNVLGDVSWVKPMKYVGIWWGMHIGHWTFGKGERHGATTARARQYIDFAAKYGFDEVLVEGWNEGWKSTPDWYLDDGRDISFTQSTPDYDLVAVQDYAKSKGVTLQIYHETMANADNYLSQIDSAFSLAHRLGIRSAKIGQVGHKLNTTEWHASQYGVNYYRKVLETAAKYHIAVNFHEPIKDTGERRTYPNMLSREGARGMEYDAWSGDGGNPPSHTCTLPFTRLLGGPMDFTPGMFELTIPGRPNNQVNTTLAKQLALYVVIYSPIQMAADLIEHYEGVPAFQFIRDVPVDWETTLVPDAEIGHFVTVVRKDRNSDDWYLGSITDENARNFSVGLSFLEAGQVYEAQIYKDASDADYRRNPAMYQIETRRVTNADSLRLVLAPGGGAAVRFNRQDAH